MSDQGQQMPELYREMASIDEKLDRLTEEIGVLSGKLSPICRPEAQEDAPGKVSQSPVTEFGQRLKAADNQIQTLLERVASLNNTLEV